MLFSRCTLWKISAPAIVLFALTLLVGPGAIAAEQTPQGDAFTSSAAGDGYYGEHLLLLAQADDEEEDDLFDEYEDESQPVADPLEGFNKAMFTFNDYLYSYLFKPVSYVYAGIIIEEFRMGIANFFYNLRFPVRFVGCLLQGKMTKMGKETGRFLLNSTMGIGGLLDPADTIKGLEKPSPEDFGQTFGNWGIGHGFYLVLPLFGPSSARDAVGTVADVFLDPLTWLNNDVWGTHYYAASALEAVNAVSLTLYTEDRKIQYDGEYDALKRDFGVNPYVGFRNAYIQNRDELVAK